MPYGRLRIMLSQPWTSRSHAARSSSVTAKKTKTRARTRPPHAAATITNSAPGITPAARLPGAQSQVLESTTGRFSISRLWYGAAIQTSTATPTAMTNHRTASIRNWSPCGGPRLAANLAALSSLPPGSGQATVKRAAFRTWHRFNSAVTAAPRCATF